eukprot:gene24199-biopygen9891
MPGCSLADNNIVRSLTFGRCQALIPQTTQLRGNSWCSLFDRTCLGAGYSAYERPKGLFLVSHDIVPTLAGHVRVFSIFLLHHLVQVLGYFPEQDCPSPTTTRGTASGVLGAAP